MANQYKEFEERIKKLTLEQICEHYELDICEVAEDYVGRGSREEIEEILSGIEQRCKTLEELNN